MSSRASASTPHAVFVVLERRGRTQLLTSLAEEGRFEQAIVPASRSLPHFPRDVLRARSPAYSEGRHSTERADNSDLSQSYHLVMLTVTISPAPGGNPNPLCDT